MTADQLVDRLGTPEEVAALVGFLASGQTRLHHGARLPGGRRRAGADRHPVTGREVHLVRYPRGEVRESDFRVVDVDIDDPGTGQVLVRNTWTSVDAAHRLRLREKAPAGYFAASPWARHGRDRDRR